MTREVALVSTVYRKAEGTAGEREAQVADRIRRGVVLYAERHQDIEYRDGAYFVPSCSGYGSYRVILGNGHESCNCADVRGRELGVCKHRVAALIAEAKRPAYEVRKVHDSRYGGYVYALVEVRLGLEREVSRRLSCTDVYLDKWQAEGYRLEVA
jgi:hypothetical protein